MSKSVTNSSLDEFDYGPEWRDSMKRLKAIVKNRERTEISKDTAEEIINVCMPTCSHEKLDDEIFSVVCPVISQLLYTNVSLIEEILMGRNVVEKIQDATTFDSQFMEIKNVLQLWQKIITHITKIKPAHSITETVREKLPLDLRRISRHCRKYENEYSNGVLPIPLKEILQQSGSLVEQYCTFYSETLKYESDADLDLIRDITVNFGEMAPYFIFGMDIMMQGWGSFAMLERKSRSRITENEEYVEFIREYFMPLGEDIIELYRDLTERPFEEFEVRAKNINTLFKLLIDLHEVYSCETCPFPTYVDAVVGMTRIIVLLTGHIEVSTSSLVDGRTAYFRDQIFTVDWLRTLNDYYENLEAYRAALRTIAKEIETKDNPELALGFHFFLLRYREFPVYERLDRVLENINYVMKEMLEKTATKPGYGDMYIGREVDATIYEYTLSVMCTLLDRTNLELFGTYESILLKHLLGEQFYSSLLAYDMLLHFYKGSDKELAFTHIHYFMMAFEALLERQDDSLAVTMLRRVIVDIYGMLSKRKREKLLDLCESPASLLLLLKSENAHYSHDKLLDTYKRLTVAETPDSLSAILVNLGERPTTDNWKQLINILTLMGLEQGEDNDEYTENLLDLTFSALKTIQESDECNIKRSMYEVLSLLFDCAQLQDKKRNTRWFNWALFAALCEGIPMLSEVPDDFLIKLCYYLNNNEDRLVVPYGDDDETAIIHSMFIYLLKNKSQLVYQEALESIAQVYKNPVKDFVKGFKKAIANHPKLCNVISKYLKREILHDISNESPHGWREPAATSSHFLEFSKSHKCYKAKDSDSGQKLPKYLKQKPLDDEAIKLSEEITQLFEQSYNLSEHVIEKLNTACRLFTEN